MNLLQLVLKQMRQRALSTWLTLLSVLLGSALAIGVLILQRESGNVFVQTDFGYDVLIGVKGSPMQLVLNTIYHVDVSPGNVPYVLYEGLRNDRGNVKFAVPYVVGDTYKGHRVIGTSPVFFGYSEDGAALNGYDAQGRLKPGFTAPARGGEAADASGQVAAATFEYRVGHRFTLGQGRMFHPRKFEAVIGSDITEKTGLKLGDRFKVAHDSPGAKASDLDEHDEQWEVVGVLNRTGTAEDRVLFIPMVSFYAIPQHEKALEMNYAAKAGIPMPSKAPPVKEPAPPPAAKDDHDHDHDHDKPATHATTKAAATKPHAHDDHDHPAAPGTPRASATTPAQADAHKDHDHDHDHDAAPKSPAPATKPATTAAAHKHDDHDHDHANEKGTPAAATGATRPEADDHAGHDHDEAYDLNPDGTINLKLTKDKWQLSAILIKARSNFAGMLMQDTFRRGDVAMAVNPASVMREFFNTFLKPSTLVLLVVVLVVVVSAAVSILVSIYNAVVARSREIAIMRALGATRGKILTLICTEAGLIGLVGGLVGIILGHGLGAVISTFFEQKMGTGIDWVSTSWHEWVYLGGVVILAVLAGLVPGLKAYRTPVATNLVAA
jgi:putative ABC transport system permease protein